jgi:hypothetical protein
MVSPRDGNLEQDVGKLRFKGADTTMKTSMVTP